MSRLFVLLLVVSSLPNLRCEDPEIEDNPFLEDAEDGDQQDGQLGVGSYDGDISSTTDGMTAPPDAPQLPQLTQEHMEKLHDHFDDDADGKVSIQEILKFNEKAKKTMIPLEVEEMLKQTEYVKDGSAFTFEEHMSEVKEMYIDAANEAEKPKFKAFEEAKFKAIDRDGDGKLDKTELGHLMNPETHPEAFALIIAETMRRYDKNGDGILDSIEWAKKTEDYSGGLEMDNLEIMADFHMVDANQDSFIDKDELKLYESGHTNMKDAMTKLLHMADKDGDEHFTKEELANMADKVGEDHEAHQPLMKWVFNYVERNTGKDEM